MTPPRRGLRYKGVRVSDGLANVDRGALGDHAAGRPGGLGGGSGARGATMTREPALDLICTTWRDCEIHRRSHGLPLATIGACNRQSCPIYTGCPVLRRQTRGMARLRHTRPTT